MRFQINSYRCMKVMACICAPLLMLFSAYGNTAEPILTVKQLMNGLVTPATNTIWGAYQLETEAQWKEIENAALTVIAAGNLLRSGGAASGEIEIAQQQLWQNYTQQLISAADKVLGAAKAKDEAVLSQVGNDDLYPPCESCHQQYQSK